jgi:hypothetical protein
MSQQELLKFVCQKLDELKIAYMVTGSIASSLHGEPRATHDIDIVIALQLADASRFVQALTLPDFLLQEESVNQAIRRSSQFNLLDLTGGDKVDFWLLTSEAFDQARFARRTARTAFGLTLQVSSAEDTVLAKLRWAQMMGGSEKQMRDVLSIVETQGPALDIDYVKEWSVRLGVQNEWETIQAAKGDIKP